MMSIRLITPMWSDIYLEILAKPAHRTPENPRSSPVT
jgi:hypothetical protein